MSEGVDGVALEKGRAEGHALVGGLTVAVDRGRERSGEEGEVLGCGGGEVGAGPERAGVEEVEGDGWHFCRHSD